MKSPSFRIFRSKTAAIHIQSYPNTVAKHGHEQHQQAGNQRQTSADVEQQSDAGNHLQYR